MCYTDFRGIGILLFFLGSVVVYEKIENEIEDCDFIPDFLNRFIRSKDSILPWDSDSLQQERLLLCYVT